MKQQPLKLADIWKITYNEFFVADPEIENANDHSWGNFKEDMLQIENRPMGLLIDLGWYPEFTAAGEFKLMLVKLSKDPDEMTNNWESPLKTFYSKNRVEIARTIEKWASTNGKS